MIFLIAIIILYFIFSPVNTAYAQSDFSTVLERDVLFLKDGDCLINEKFIIKNNKTDKYLPSFEYTVSGLIIDNTDVFDVNGTLNYTVDTSEDINLFKIYFSNKALGKNKQQNFSIKYSTKDIASRTGDVWQIALPIVRDIHLYDDVKTRLIIPNDFGPEAYITPKYVDKKINEDNTVYTFDKNDLVFSKIIAVFGEYQSFSFSINYKFDEKSGGNNLYSVSVPMDTSYQRVIFNKIDGPLDNIIADKDGNWIAQFLPNDSFKDITISGFVQIFSQPRKHLVPAVDDLYNNINPTHYWNSNEVVIRNIAKELKTPRDVYDYVVNYLEYDKNLHSYKRRPSTEILSQNRKGICRDFTDLFISIMRAKGIPAREVIGYAHTDNPDAKPVSFFTDILHSWVEYWDSDKGIWVPSDPTWGKTSGADYFNNFDLRHFAFTIHGHNDSIPVPPGVYSNNGENKNIFVSTSQYPDILDKQLIPQVNSGISDVLDGEIDIYIKNENGFALYEKNIKYYFDGILVAEDNHKVLPPYSLIHKKLPFSHSFLGRSTVTLIGISVNGDIHEYTGPDKMDLYAQLILIFSLFVIVIFSYIYFYKRHAKISF